MTKAYYENIPKMEYLLNPDKYAWNCILHYIQFTQEELLSVREVLEIREVVRYQTAATTKFLRDHFQKEIDECLEVDWDDVKIYTRDRDGVAAPNNQ